MIRILTLLTTIMMVLMITHNIQTQAYTKGHSEGYIKASEEYHKAKLPKAYKITTVSKSKNPKLKTKSNG